MKICNRTIEIYTDRSKSSAIQVHGGWAVIVLEKTDDRIIMKEKISQHFKEHVTNNQMELIAMIKALHLASNDYKNEKVIIYSDSAYCVNICNDWIWGWFQNNWTNSKGVTIENKEIITLIWDYIQFPCGSWSIEKIPGHSGIIGNELADALCTKNEAKFTEIIKKHSIWYTEMNLFEF